MTAVHPCVHESHTIQPQDLDNAIRLRQADHGVYVAHRGFEYAGFVELTEKGYRAHSAIGTNLGTHAELDDARRALVAAQVEPARPRTRRVRKPRWPHRAARKNTATLNAA